LCCWLFVVVAVLVEEKQRSGFYAIDVAEGKRKKRWHRLVVDLPMVVVFVVVVVVVVFVEREEAVLRTERTGRWNDPPFTVAASADFYTWDGIEAHRRKGSLFTHTQTDRRAPKNQNISRASSVGSIARLRMRATDATFYTPTHKR
jgi:hypothetical protein